MELNNKVALVTGSAHRVGRQLALSLASEGCDLVVHYNQSKKEAEATKDEIYKIGGRAIPIQANLGSYEGVKRLFDEVDRQFGQLDILVNSAAILQPVDLLDVSQTEWDKTMDLNLKGAFFCLQFAAQRMKVRGSGAIVNISDIIGHKAWAKFPVHSVSKAALEMITRVAAIALAPEIRVNAIAPGLILKPSDLDESRWKSLSSKTSLKRSGTPNDLSDALLFLLKNDYVTGEILVLDGGLSLVE
jgi:pteridine reductase